MTSQITSARVSFTISMEEINSKLIGKGAQPITQKEFFELISNNAVVSFYDELSTPLLEYPVKLSYITR